MKFNKKFIIVIIIFLGLILGIFVAQSASAKTSYKHKQWQPTPTVQPCEDLDQAEMAQDRVTLPCITITPTASPSATPTPETSGTLPTFAGSSTDAPVCSDRSTISLAANVHVLRAGTDATVNFFLTEGNSANIYWRVVGQTDWQYAVFDVQANADKFVSYTVHDLDANLGYDFGVQQKVGCGGGQLATAIVVDGPIPTLFPFSYWEWSK